MDAAAIQEDLIEFKKREDPDPDHFRHRRLTQWLQEKTNIPANEFDLLCKLHKNDIDVGYANSVVVSYYGLKLLDEHSTELLENKIEKLSPFLKSFVAEKRLKRKIKTGISQEELQQLIMDKKHSILRQLAELTDSSHTLETLANYKGSKRIRNIAKERMKIES